MSQGAEFGLSQIGQVAVNVKDVKRATSFYRDTLGVRFLFDTPTMSFFDCGGVRLLLGVAEKPEFDHPSSILYFRVENIQEAYNILGARGVPFEGKPHRVAQLADHDLWMAFFRDPENNLLALMSEVRRD